MRFVSFIMLAFSLNALAETIHTPEKNLIIRQAFAPNAKELAQRVQTPFIKVVKEQINFNKGPVKNRMLEAIDMVEVIVNSEKFKEQVIGFINTNGVRSYTRNEGLTNEEIYLRLMEGKEVLDRNTPGEMNLYIQQYHRWWSKVIGYTKIGTSKFMWVNWKFYKNFAASEMASNIVHEWVHLMGFYHDSANDHDSVPYAIGYITRHLVEQYVRTGRID